MIWAMPVCAGRFGVLRTQSLRLFAVPAPATIAKEKLMIEIYEPVNTYHGPPISERIACAQEMVANARRRFEEQRTRLSEREAHLADLLARQSNGER